MIRSSIDRYGSRYKKDGMIITSGRWQCFRILKNTVVLG
jgi:hypothetical protein